MKRKNIAIAWETGYDTDIVVGGSTREVQNKKGRGNRRGRKGRKGGGFPGGNNRIREENRKNCNTEIGCEDTI